MAYGFVAGSSCDSDGATRRASTGEMTVPKKSRKVPAPTPAQERAIAALVAGKTATEAAAEAGVDRRTLYRWSRDDTVFITSLNLARVDLAAAVRDKLAALGAAAVEVVREVMQSQDTPARVRLAAALAVLERAPTAAVSHHDLDPEWLAAHRQLQEALWESWGPRFLGARPTSLTHPEWEPRDGRSALPYPLDPDRQPPPPPPDHDLSAEFAALLGRPVPGGGGR
jgi:hypothetical protein